jgi:hypothetical protein
VSEASRRAGRTLLQLVASGTLTAAVGQLAGGLSPGVAGLVLSVWTVAVAYAQNALEDAGKLPKIMKS